MRTFARKSFSQTVIPNNKDGRTHKTKITTAPGGVARNMCEALKKLSLEPIFLSAIGNDLFGRELLLQFERVKLDPSHIFRSNSFSTAIYSALLNHSGECEFGMGDMSIHGQITSDYILHHKSLIQSAPIVLLDANIPVESISTVLELCSESKTPIWFEPTEIRKTQKLCMTPAAYWKAVSYMSPNIHELKSMLSLASNNRSGQNQRWTFKDTQQYIAELIEAVTNCFHVFPGLEMLLLTKGREGIMVTFKDIQGQHLESFTLPAPVLEDGELVSVSGAGDCLNAGFISSLLMGNSWLECARFGTSCAKQSLKSSRNVPESFT